MTRITVEDTRPLGSPHGPLAGVGRDDQKRAFGFFARGSVDATIDMDPKELLDLPDAWPTTTCLRTVGAWPAWRLATAAAVELGSLVRVVGGGTLAESVERMVALRGGSPAGGGTADSVILLDDTAHALARVLASCRTSATVVIGDPHAGRLDLNLYPDAHRRGLRIVGVDLVRAEAGCWQEVRALLHRALAEERHS